MKRSLTILIVLFCSVQLSWSQQDDGIVSFDLPIRNSLVFNRYAINPTFTFVREQNKYISFNNKRENIQFDNAPETFVGSYSGRFAENIGAGISAFQQNYGVLTTFGGLLNFAYNVKLNTDKNLTFGLNVAAYKSGINTANVITNFDDPSLQNVPENFLFTLNPGVNFGTTFLDFGVAINNLVLYNFETSEMIQDDPRQGIQAHVMHTGFFNGRGFFKDTKFSGLLMSEFRKDETIISGLASLSVPKGIWFQVGYNSRFGVSGGLGLNITKNIALEYNIEKAIGELVEFGSSHEISLAYRFIPRKKFDYTGDEEVSGLFSKKRNRPIVKASEEELAGIRARAAERRAQAKLDREAEEKAEKEAEANALKAAEDKAKLEAEEKAKREAEAQERKAAAEKAREAAEAKARIEAEQKAREKAEAEAKLLAEQQAKQEAEEKAIKLAEQKEREEAARQAKLLEEQKAKEAEEKANAEAEAREKLIAEQKAKEEAEAQARLLAEQKAKEEAEERARQLAAQKAKEEAKAQAKLLEEQRAKEAAEQKAKEEAEAKAQALEAEKQKQEAIENPKDELGKSIATLTKDAESSKTEQNRLLDEFKNIIEIKDVDLKDLKEENDLSDQGIAVQPKPFKSVTEENNRLNAIKADLEEVIKLQGEKIDSLTALYDLRFKTTELDEVNLFYKKKIQDIKDDQLKAKEIKQQLEVRLEDIRIATEFEKRRRIKRAAYDNEEDRYAQDRAMLANIKRTTKPPASPYTSDDFDFGEEQSENIKILKNVKNTESGYYLVIAVHNDINKRNEFLTKVVASGRANVDFFYDVSSSKYYIYYNKFDSISAANKAMDNKGDRPYNIKMSLIKIEN